MGYRPYIIPEHTRNIDIRRRTVSLAELCGVRNRAVGASVGPGQFPRDIRLESFTRKSVLRDSHPLSRLNRIAHKKLASKTT